MTPLVSVIIPVYNNEMYLKQCLDSLINQTLRNIEIICVNDGSTDTSMNILKEYSLRDSRIILINQKNQGQSAARNAGINAAKGEYIGFLDSDDWTESTMFEKLYNNAKQFDSDIAMCSITMFDESTENYNSHDSYMTLDLFPSSFENRVFRPQETFDFIFRICVTPWNKIYKTKFLKRNNVKFVEGLNFEDTVFCVETLLNADRLSIIKQPLVFYRKNSITSYSHSSKHDEKKLDFFKIFKLEEKIIKEKGLWKQLKKYYYFHKNKELKYWLSKIKNKKIKLIYILLLYTKKPLLVFSLLIEYINYLQALNTLKKHKNKKIIFWGASLFLEKILKSSMAKDLKIEAIIDTNKAMYKKEIWGHKLILPNQIKDINADILIPTVPNIYKFEKFVERYLDENDINLKVVNLI